MYKFTSQLANPKLVLVRRHLGDGKCALIVMRTPPRRNAHYDPSNCPPTPKAKPKSRKLLWGTIGATILTGAAVVYAKGNPDARNWIETHAPWANDFIALVYQENTTYWQFSVNQMNKAGRRIGDFMFGREGISPVDLTPKSEQNLEADAAKQYAKKEYDLPPPPFLPLYKEEKIVETPDVEHVSTLIRTEKSEPPKPQPVKITKDMVEIEHDMHENTKVAIDSYRKATEFCTKYNKALYKIVELPAEEIEKKHLGSLKGAMTERDALHEKARDAAAKARCAIETLDRLLTAGVQAPPDSVAATRRFIKQFRGDLLAAETTFKEEYDKQVIADKYWGKVESARKHYKEELELLFPGLDLAARSLHTQADTDLLLIYTLKQIEYLQKELAEVQTVRELKINRALECKDEKAIIEAKVEDMVKTEMLAKEQEFQKKSLAIQAEANKKLKEQLKKQYEIQQECLQDALNRKEKEVMGQYGRLVSEQVEKERVEFKKELAAMAGKLKAIEQTLKQRARAEAEAKRSQSLWAAGEALLAATRRRGDRTPLDKELTALEKAGQGDKLVQTVLKGIPDEVRKKGIVTEKTLRDKFDTLEKTTMKVALIGREGATLPMYFLSWLQSKLLFQSLGEIPQDELNNLPTDFSKLDTFDIMQRARYHMDHGNLSAALQYVNLLQGAPRAAAQPWSDSARRHLEIRQAAEAVMAHASVSGLLYL